MNADDRANPPSARIFSPVSNTAEEPVSGTQPVTGQAPATGSAPTTGAVPTTGSVPRRSAMRPTASSQYATGQAPAPAPATQPLTGTHGVAGANPAPQPTTGAHSVAGVAPATQPAHGASAFTAGAAGAVGAGMGKLKDYATKAKDSLTEGDDVTAARGKGGPRKARVLLSRIDPWSALKIGFLLSIAMGIMMVVAVFVLWSALNQQGVFVMINDWIVKLFTTNQEVDLLQFTSLRKVMSATVLLSIINVVLLTALTTIGAFLYNVVSSVVGGVYVTLTDD